MKKCFILSAILSVLALAAMVFCHISINSTSDAVYVEENTISGDISAANGLYVNIGTIRGSYLQWDTGFYLTEEPDEDVEFTYNDRQNYSSTSDPTSYLELGLYLNYGVGSTGSINLDDYEPSKLIKLAAENTASGETKNMTFNMKDYYDYIPLECNVYIRLDKLYNDDEAYEEKILNYVKLPALSDVDVTITVQKNSRGEVCDIEVNSEMWTVDSCSADTGDGIYFMLDCEGVSTESLAAMPCGYGIYYLPYWKGDGKYVETGDVITAQEFDPYETVLVSLDLSNDGKALYALAKEQDLWVVYVYSADTCELIERFELFEDKNKDVDITAGDGYIVYSFLNGHILLITSEGGECALSVNCDTDIQRYYEMPLTWDGERLAICDSDPYSLRNMRIYVLSGENVLYSGELDHSQKNLCQLNYRADRRVILEFR